jgi:hypothetical protein
LKSRHFFEFVGQIFIIIACFFELGDVIFGLEEFVLEEGALRIGITLFFLQFRYLLLEFISLLGQLVTSFLLFSSFAL